MSLFYNSDSGSPSNFINQKSRSIKFYEKKWLEIISFVLKYIFCEMNLEIYEQLSKIIKQKINFQSSRNRFKFENFFVLKKKRTFFVSKRCITSVSEVDWSFKLRSCNLFWSKIKKNGFLVKNCNPKYWQLITCLNFCNCAPYEKVTLEMWGSLV